MHPINWVKRIYSVGLLIFSVVCIMALIVNKMTGLSKDVHPVLAFILIWIAILWLTMVEGGQASLVGLAPVNPDLYKDSHPLSYKCTQLCHEGDNLDRYLLGRQFMVVLVVFTVNISGGPIKDAELWGFPGWLMGIFFSYGLAMILFTCMVGQLNTQVNASLFMLDYINNYFALFTLYVAMLIEFSGLLHSAYVVQLLVTKLAGQSIHSNEPPRNPSQNAFFWARCTFSLAVLGFSFAVTLEALFGGKTTMWKGVPAIAAVIIFFILMSVVGMLEGMQIAFFAVAKLTPDERGDTVWAKKTCNLLYFGEGNNLPGFMVGRQLCVVSCMLFIARVTSVSVKKDGSENVFGASAGWQELFNTGLLGAFITTIVASISWQLVASAFPIAFLNNPITYILLRWCLFLESTGICAGAWVIAGIHKSIAGFQRDEVYIGTAESRSKMDMTDQSTRINVGPGHIVKLPNFAETAPKSLQQLLKKDPSVGAYINSITAGADDNTENNAEDNA
uniref:Silicon transporter n=1 Tax=Eucampia antarctica TaxID=49252 RepID=A0A7S2RTW3_9STRA|mmetsp:Transcript_26747/g.25608  ORF Transcript_26747/g.25608 Transcript_26747/m.25608 type:complete len:504 (+) Transcript_26747:103-1614(+)